MTVQHLKMCAHSKYLESVLRLVVVSHDQSANSSMSCTDKPQQAAFDVPAPHVEWAEERVIPAVDSTAFNQ